MTACASDSESLKSCTFIYGNVHVAYHVKRKVAAAGKPRKISIRVTPDSQVVVSAPKDANANDIHDAVMKRAKWIYNSLQSFGDQQFHVQPRRYVSGEMQFYLGRRYVLKVVENTDSAPRVKMERGKLLVHLPKFRADKAEHVRELIKQWYRVRAHYIFNARLQQLLPQASWVNDLPEFRILSMKKQWGSCSTQGTLILNPHLVKAPRDCIDYVILHELCHIKEHNHGERFYRLLRQVMPEWKSNKQHLDNMAELFLND
ncbi:metal-dependent hydrolase [Chromatiales bacterium (ex Bugula neritina AB1)]|nr:metal-dependent hydrolase [Chromatiales bacterium (ex Bugula neritina AB1)]